VRIYTKNNNVEINTGEILDRTNSHAEAAHRKVYAELGSNHPVTWKFTDGIRKIHRGRDAYCEQLIPGKAPNEKVLKYIRTERISNIANHFYSRAPLEYLRSLACNYDIN